MRTRTAVLAGAVVVAASVATAVASIPGPGGTINGCYNPADPAPIALSIVDDPADCKLTLLPFNQTGPTGPAGAAGTLGSSSRVITALSASGPDIAGTAVCPAGTILLGGGFELGTVVEGFDVASSAPTGDMRGWYVMVKRRPGFISGAEIGDAFQRFMNGLLPSLEENEEAQREAVRALGAMFGIPSPGGARVTSKEQKKLTRTVKKVVSESKQMAAATEVALSAAAKLGAGPAVPAPAPTDAKAYAVCGAT
jgi:hypothetical protein